MALTSITTSLEKPLRKDWHEYCVRDYIRQNSVSNKNIEHMHRKSNTIGCICITLLVTNAIAADFQSHSSIHETASQYVMDHVKSIYDTRPVIKPGKLDSRLKLRLCTQPLTAYLPDRNRGIGKTTVSVKCSDHKPWSLHVPVLVSLFKEVLVAKESLPRGKLLEVTDLKQVKYDLARLPHGYISEYSASVGMKLKRPLVAGAALTPNMVEKPRIISRGQRVTILAQVGGIEVRTSGKALAHGTAGQRISVQNIKSKRKLEGTVLASGEVKIDI
jgi:flagella basal body P-ring formation protein FlgA